MFLALYTSEESTDREHSVISRISISTESAELELQSVELVHSGIDWSLDQPHGSWFGGQSTNFWHSVLSVQFDCSHGAESGNQSIVL